MFKNKIILVTGGTGSFGNEFVKKLLKFNPKKILIFSRDEQKQFIMEENFKLAKNKLRFLIGDIRDKDRLDFALKNVDYVVHAAALKIVPISEYNPFEVVKTNIFGAQNLIDCCIKNNVRKVIALSTDKASSPTNLYGATKLTSDKLFVAANNYKGKIDTVFSVVRYGNVMNSRGSVIPYFLKLKKKNYFPITDLKMTRFNITLKHSVDLVLSVFRRMVGGEIFVPKIPSYKLVDLAKAISSNAKFNIIGIRPGEKLHEEMISLSDAPNTLEFNKYYVITPNSKYNLNNLKNYKKKFGGKRCSINFTYNSLTNKNFLSISDLKKLIKTVN